MLTDGATTITSGISTVVEVFGQCWDLMLANPLIMVFVGTSLIGVGIGVFKKLKKGVR